MDKFVLNIRKKYKDRLINREKQWPPCHGNKLVKLQIVERGRGECYQANVQRGRENKAVKRTPLFYADLLKAEKGGKPVRKVLVEGDAGIGKTTLSISLSEDWACEKLFQEFELLLLLTLRHKEVASVGSLTDLLKLLHPSYDVCKAVAEYVENEEERVLIIADGWDELSESDQQEGSFLYKLLFETFPLMSVIVTSRPSASTLLHRLPCIDRFVEINGFTKDDIKEYIESEFTSDQEKASRLLEQLEDNPLVESVCSIPLNSAIICHLWRTLEEDLPPTMTQLYTKIILNVILRNIQKKDAFKNISRLPSISALPEDLQPSFKLLCKFAFQSLEKSRIIFSQEELAELFPEGLASVLSFGLLQTSETVLETGRDLSFHFIHLTFMEFLTALHFVELSQNTDLKKLCQEHKDLCYKNSHFTMVWRFFFGIQFSSNVKEVTSAFITQAIRCVAYSSLKGEVTLSLCHCAYEAQYNLIPDTIFALNIFKIYFVHPRTTYDCATVLYIIDHIKECRGIVIDFSDSGIGNKHVEMLRDVLVRKAGILQVNDLRLNGNKLTGECLYDLFYKASAAFIQTKVNKFTGLTSLNLSNNHLEASGLNVLEKIVRNNLLSTLSSLYLQGSLTTDDDFNAKWLTSFIDTCSTCCPRIRTLDLSENKIGVAGAAALAQGLSKLQHSTSNASINFSLYLSRANICDDILKVFVDNIQDVCTFLALCLSDNRIHAAGISYLADAVCSGKIVIHSNFEFDSVARLCRIDVNNNPLGLSGLTAVGRMLGSKNCQPSSIDLSGCILTSQHVNLSKSDTTVRNSFVPIDVEQKLFQMQKNYSVRELYLSNNTFTMQSVHVIVDLMQLCNSLEHLTCNACGITADELILLLEKIVKVKESSESNNFIKNLEIWELYDNNINKCDERLRIILVDYPYPCGRLDMPTMPPCVYPVLKSTRLVRHPEYPDDWFEDYEGSESYFFEGFEQYLIKHPEYVCSITNNSASVQPSLRSSYCEESPDLQPPTPKKQKQKDDIDYGFNMMSSTIQSASIGRVTSDSSISVTDSDRVNDIPSLTESDLASVQKAVWEGRSKWYNLGLQLGLTAGTLDAIQMTNHDQVDRCFTETLKTWLRCANLHPSWSGLAEALRALPVGLGQLAEQLPNLDPST